MVRQVTIKEAFFADDAALATFAKLINHLASVSRRLERWDRVLTKHPHRKSEFSSVDRYQYLRSTIGANLFFEPEINSKLPRLLQ